MTYHTKRPDQDIRGLHMAIDHFRNEVSGHSNDGDQAHPLESPRIEVAQANSTVIHFQLLLCAKQKKLEERLAPCGERVCPV